MVIARQSNRFSIPAIPTKSANFTELTHFANRANRLALLCILIALLSSALSPSPAIAQAGTGSNEGPAIPSIDKADIEKARKKVTQTIEDVTNIDLNTMSVREVIEQIPPIVPAVIALICIIPLLWGGKIVRLVYTFFFAFLFGSLAYGMGAHFGAGSPWMAIVAGMIGSSLGSVLGWYSIKIGSALVGAFMFANIMALIGLMFGSEVLAIILALIGFVAGLVLGWKIAYYYQALVTSLYSAVIMGICTYVALYETNITLGAILGLVIFVAGSVLGCIVQFNSVREFESGKIGTATTAETKRKVEKAMKKNKSV